MNRRMRQVQKERPLGILANEPHGPLRVASCDVELFVGADAGDDLVAVQ
jgi:hypothetical protein